MAQVSKFEEINLSSLDDRDLFYVVDYKSTEDRPVSKKITYQVLKNGIDRDIEKVQIIKGCSYNKESKILELSVGLSDGGVKILSIDLEELNVYHAEDGVSTKIGDDNTFVADWTVVSKVGHGHEISDINELEDELSDIEQAFKTVNEELDKKALSVHTHVKNEITDFGSYLSSSESYLTSDSLEGLSDNWETAYSRTSADVGSIGYKNSLSTSDIHGYKDTTYSNGFGLSVDGTEFGVDTNQIAIKNHSHDYPVTSVNGKTGAVTVRTFEEFPSQWKNSGVTMTEFCKSILDTDPEVGRCFLGGISRMDPMPPGFPSWGNIEVIVEVPVTGVYTIKASSSDTQPYYWMCTSNNGEDFTGWKMILSISAPQSNGTFTLKCVKNGDEDVKLQWIQD